MALAGKEVERRGGAIPKQPEPLPGGEAPLPEPGGQTAPAPAPAPPSPAPGPEPAPIPGGGGGAPQTPKPQQVAQTEGLTPGQRPGSAASMQALAARAGVRLGAFDPRFRYAEGGPTAISAAASPIPPSLGFHPKQYEQEQLILGALRGR